LASFSSRVFSKPAEIPTGPLEMRDAFGRFHGKSGSSRVYGFQTQRSKIDLFRPTGVELEAKQESWEGKTIGSQYKHLLGKTLIALPGNGLPIGKA
jgi:hypothetical protein